MLCMEKVITQPPAAHLRLRDDGSYDVHELKDHLQGVARRAAQFAEELMVRKAMLYGCLR